MTCETRPNSSLILVRHGEAKYTDEGRDLTPEGEEQIKRTAESLEKFLGLFDRVVMVRSPKARTLGSGVVFRETLDGRLVVTSSKISSTARAVDIADDECLLLHRASMSSHGGLVYWVVDPFFQGNEVRNEDGQAIGEGRLSVERRSDRLRRHYLGFLTEEQNRAGMSLALVVFTHMEVMLPFLQAVYTSDPTFPSREDHLPKNAEPIIIETCPDRRSVFLVRARGKEERVTYDTAAGRFALSG